MQICKAGDEETEDVVVDGDDTAAFGPTQFNENDIQSAAADHSSHDEGNLPIAVNIDGGRWTRMIVCFVHTGMIKSEKEAQMTFKETDSKDHIINALKNRVNDLEEMNKEAKQKNRCLICLVCNCLSSCGFTFISLFINYHFFYRAIIDNQLCQHRAGTSTARNVGFKHW